MRDPERPSDDDAEADADRHAAARDRRRAKERSGMQVSGRSTRSLHPELIARRGRAAAKRTRPREPEDTDERADDR
jgi:hypothetical protein